MKYKSINAGFGDIFISSYLYTACFSGVVFSNPRMIPKSF